MAAAAPDLSISDLIQLLAHGSRQADGAGAGVEVPGMYRWLVFEQVITNSGSAGSLACWVQQSHDGGANWDDLARFGDWIGGGGAIYQYATVPQRVSEGAGEVHQGTDATLAVATVRATVTGSMFRVRWSGMLDAFTWGVYVRVIR